MEQRTFTHNSVIKGQITQIKNWAKDLSRYFIKVGAGIANKYMKRCPTSLFIKLKCKLRPQWNTTLHQVEWLKVKRLTTASVGEDEEHIDSQTLLVWVWNSTTTLENCHFLKMKYKSSILNSNNLWRHYTLSSLLLKSSLPQVPSKAYSMKRGCGGMGQWRNLTNMTVTRWPSLTGKSC